MSMIRTFTIFVLAIALCLPVWAQTPEQERIKALERENDELRQELALLRLELSQLKRELRELKPAEARDTQDPADPGVDQPEADEQDKNEKDKARKFRSTDEIYRSLPRDMRPARDGWDVVEKRTVFEWLKTNITGKRFEARKRIAQVEVDYDALKGLWEVTLYFDVEEMRYMNWDMQERLADVVLTGDQAFAKDARRKFKVGGTVSVSGTISKIEWDLITTQDAEDNWHPTHCTLWLDRIQVK